MQKTTFAVPQMDCPSEESLIRLKLDGLACVRGLDFDLPGRRLFAFRDGGLAEIEQSVAELNLGGRRLSTEEAGGFVFEEEAGQRKLLWTVLAIITTMSRMAFVSTVSAEPMQSRRMASPQVDIRIPSPIISGCSRREWCRHDGRHLIFLCKGCDSQHIR